MAPIGGYEAGNDGADHANTRDKHKLILATSLQPLHYRRMSAIVCHSTGGAYILRPTRRPNEQ
jgi:hypothetical protein